MFNDSNYASMLGMSISPMGTHPQPHLEDEDSLINKDLSSDKEWIANPNDEESTAIHDEELNFDVDEIRDEYEDDFGVVENEIGFDDIDRDGLNNFEYDHLPNDLMWSKEPCMGANVTRSCKLVRMTWLRVVNC
ncbi:hypothetical protein Q3G72_033838 [Acer saccharum]|nr:hypothetical protein Q3G72_033838 [Acer saccharum]